MRTSFYRNWLPVIIGLAVICFTIGMLRTKKSEADPRNPAYGLMSEARSEMAAARPQKAEDARKLADYDRIAAEAAQCKTELADLRTVPSAVVGKVFVEPPNSFCFHNTRFEYRDIAAKIVPCEVTTHVCITPQPKEEVTP